MTRPRSAMLVVFALALAASGIAGRITTASSATAPTYTVTVSGSDAHPIDAHILNQFVPGGGANLLYTPGSSSAYYPYLEAGLALPVGAKVTSLAVYLSYCYGNDGRVTFGSYAPATKVTQQVVTLGAPSIPGCASSAFIKTGNPITTVVAGRRYALDYATDDVTNQYSATANSYFTGAVLKYTCTSPCVP